MRLEFVFWKSARAGAFLWAKCEYHPGLASLYEKLCLRKVRFHLGVAEISSYRNWTGLIYRKSSIKPPWGLFAKKNFIEGAYSKGGLIRGEGLFQSLTFSLKVEQKHTIHFPQKYTYQSTSMSSQSPISIVSSAGAADSISSASGVKDFPPPQSFIWFYLSKHAIKPPGAY